eukprot:GHUV01039551.1.p2 GENE.GHUV01039551.1~~GHUV01039551.1.p2  ORF type:complete len:111 (+),score=14.05 GHUV01039551.1:143-475(+)
MGGTAQTPSLVSSLMHVVITVAAKVSHTHVPQSDGRDSAATADGGGLGGGHPLTCVAQVLLQKIPLGQRSLSGRRSLTLTRSNSSSFARVCSYMCCSTVPLYIKWYMKQG